MLFDFAFLAPNICGITNFAFCHKYSKSLLKTGIYFSGVTFGVCGTASLCIRHLDALSSNSDARKIGSYIPMFYFTYFTASFWTTIGACNLFKHVVRFVK